MGHMIDIDEIMNNHAELDKELKVEIELVHRNLVNELKVPKEELINHSILQSKATQIWAEAKNSNDYSKAYC